MPIINAAIVDLTGSSAKVVDNNVTDEALESWAINQRLFWDNTRNNFYLFWENKHTDGSGTEIFIAKFDSTLTTRLAYKQLGLTYSNYLDHGNSVVDWNDDYFVLAYGQDGKIFTEYINKDTFELTNKTTFISSGAVTTSVKDLSMATDGTFLEYNASSSANAVGILYHSGDINADNRTGLYTPRVKTTPIYDFNWLYIPDTNEYYLIYVGYGVGTNLGTVYLDIYDKSQDDINMVGTQPKFIEEFQISTESLLSNVYYPAIDLKDEYGVQNQVQAKYYNGWVYWGYHSKETNSNNTYYFEAIDPVATKNSGWLQPIKTAGQHINFSTYDTWLDANDTHINGSAIQSVTFDFKPTDNSWWFVYHRYNRTKGGATPWIQSGFLDMVVSSTANCLCSGWLNDGSCGQYQLNQQKVVRSCNPVNCEIQNNYTDCTYAPTIKSKKKTDCAYCSHPSGNEEELYASKNPTITCDLYVDIPSNVTNVTTYALLSLYASKNEFGLWFTPDNYYNVSICNPLMTGNCIPSSHSCQDEANLTVTLGYAGYSTGGQASASVTASGLGRCTNGNFGWQKYIFYGEICVIYDKYCGGYSCTQSGGKDYSVFEFPDCTLNRTKSYCQYGCNKDTGQCEGNAITSDDLSGDPFDMTKKLVEKTFSAWVLVVLSVGITGGSAIYTTMITNKWQVALAVGLLVSLIFLAIGWLPSYIGILWVLAVVLILAKGMFLKGE